MVATKNQLVLADFISYCAVHPEERFWQALRNWAGAAFILAVPCASETSSYSRVVINDYDTFDRRGRNE
jgi:hypothetical protein